MRTGEARGPRADDRHVFARLGAAREKLHSRIHRCVCRVALQHADLDRLALGRLAHAGFFAELLGGADAGAHAAQDVLLEDRLRRAQRIVRQDLADEEGDVDRGGAGGLAGRVIAEIAPVGLDERLVLNEGRMEVREVRHILVFRQPAGRNAVLQDAVAHRAPPVAWTGGTLTRPEILSNGQFLGRGGPAGDQAAAPGR